MRDQSRMTLRCPECGNLIYPKIAPAVIVGVTDGTRIVMTRYAGREYKGTALIAGFCEIGETAEDTVRREVMEEVGLRVHNLQYFMSQSWPFPHSLMIAFTADYLDGEIRLDENEIAEARWFGPGDAWPEATSSVSISALLVRAHRAPAVG